MFCSVGVQGGDNSTYEMYVSTPQASSSIVSVDLFDTDVTALFLAAYNMIESVLLSKLQLRLVSLPFLHFDGSKSTIQPYHRELSINALSQARTK